ncbi:MAG TPA: glycosyltransferase [Jatrophihabitantaceae bacterium]|jgi:biofilm PGA synthesis N-glycosyltransferase PgaC|nr:glycosyltransferase [Jatrophihabitantaceae bacterium]
MSEFLIARATTGRRDAAVRPAGARPTITFKTKPASSVASVLSPSRPSVRTLVDRASLLRRAVTPAGVAPAAAKVEADTHRAATIACVIPAYNEQETIESVIRSLLAQTRPPDAIFVIVNNTDDDTIEIATRSVGTHRRAVRGENFTTIVRVHDIGKNADKKVGALNYGYRLARGYDYLLGVDGDTTLERETVECLELEMVDDPRIGGLSAIYTVDYDTVKGPVAKFLVAGQRAQFAAFNLDNLLAGRNMAVLGGQCSLFSMKALDDVRTHYHQQNPWVRDSEVEDSLLSLQIKKVGYSTKISAKARASVGGMSTMRALHGQQVKWNYGSIDLMWPGQRGNTKGQPFHPNLRLRWIEHFSMLINIGTRLGFLLLLAAALSIHAFVFNPIWLIPPAMAVLLNLRIAMSIKHRRGIDLLYAGLGLPAEAYMWIRMGHFATAWAQFLARVEKDNWAAQASAEKGRGSAFLWPAVIAVTVFSVLIYTWSRQSVSLQSSSLAIGWPILYLITILQTIFMLRKFIRRHRGFTA